MYGKSAPALVERKTKILLGDQESMTDRINFTAADAFPDDLNLRGLLVRHLSWDVPDARLSEQERTQLQQALDAQGKSELFNLKIEK